MNDAPDGPAVSDSPSGAQPEHSVDDVSPNTDPKAPSETAAGEQIEWRPVVDGDNIEWQPVIVTDVSTGTPADGSETGEEPSDPAAVTADAAYEGEAPWSADSEPSWPTEDQSGAETESQAEGGFELAGDPENGQWEDPSPRGAEPEFDYPDDPASDDDVDWEPAAVPLADSPVTERGAAARSRPGGARPRPGPRQGPPRRPPAAPPVGPKRTPANAKRQVMLLTVLTVLVLGIGGAAFFISRDATDTGEEAQNDSTPPASTTVSTLPESALQTFTDEQTGFSLKYAKSWERLIPPVGDIRLVVNAGGNDGFQVRVAPIQTPATTENIGNFKAVTDAVVLGDRSARLLQEQLVTVNGLLTYYYLYSFQDPLTNTEGVHAHYFIFEGNRMFMLNFQTVPIDEFVKQAGLFDQIAESFVVQPRPNTTAPPAPTTVP